MRVLLLSRYDRRGASSRVRSYQYLSYLHAAGIDVETAPLFDDGYLERIYAGRSPRRAGVAAAYAARAARLLSCGRFDVVWVEKEALPWLPGWIERGLLRRGPALLVDCDDAVFHRYDRHRRRLVRGLLGRKIDALMRRADLVLAGSTYLAERARRAGARRVEAFPTVVDTERYAPAPSADNEELVLGWIGTPRTARYLEPLARVLAQWTGAGRARMRLIGAGDGALAGVPAIERRAWSEADEVRELQAIDIGLMPLPDEPFERGKCAYKLVQYMACGKPVIASPVGASRTLVEQSGGGLLATEPSEWNAAFERLAGDRELRARLGAAGRRAVEEGYSLVPASERLARWLCELGGARAR